MFYVIFFNISYYMFVIGFVENQSRRPTSVSFHGLAMSPEPYLSVTPRQSISSGPIKDHRGFYLAVPAGSEIFICI